MTLDDYLSEQKRKTGLTEAAFGLKVGLSQSQINRLRTGESWPPKDVATRIREATDGLVSADDFMPPPAVDASTVAA